MMIRKTKAFIVRNTAFFDKVRQKAKQIIGIFSNNSFIVDTDLQEL
jgi:hypothetical protein